MSLTDLPQMTLTLLPTTRPNAHRSNERFGDHTLLNAGFYDEAYFDGPGKSNYSRYTFESSPFAAHAETIARVMEHHRLTGPILDIGCAKGYLVYLLRQRGFEAYGVDWSQYAIASARPEVAPHLRQGTATDLPFPDGAFSLAVSFDLLEHLDEPCARRAMLESARVSQHQLHQANTGRLEEWRFDEDSSHCSRYSLEHWQAMTVGLGLTRMVICEPDRRLPFLEEIAPGVAGHDAAAGQPTASKTASGSR